MEHYRHFILDRLLSLWERSSQRGRPPEEIRLGIFFKISATDCPFYFDESNPEPRLQFIADAKTLERDGLVEIRWGKGTRADEIERVYLVLDDISVAKAYALTCRKDPEEARDCLDGQVRDLIREDPPPPAWFRTLLDDVARDLSLPTISRGPISPFDPETARDLLIALNAIARTEGTERLRAFSIRLFGDSKRLETLSIRLSSLLRKYDSSLNPAGNHPLDILREYGIERKEGILLVRGTATFEGSNGTVSTDEWKPFVGIPEDIAVHGNIASITARAVLTIENEESFSALCRLSDLPSDLFVVYGGGFSNRAKVSFLRKVNATTDGKARFFHWGDLDVGGFRILLHMRKTVRPDIKMLFSSPEAIESLSRGCSPLPAEHLHTLMKDVAENPHATDLRPLIAIIVELGVRIEQEVMDPGEAVAQITEHLPLKLT